MRLGQDQHSSAESPFTTLSEENYRVFPRIKAAIQKCAGSALGKLYARIASYGPTAKLMPNQQIRDGAAKAQEQHWIGLFAGPFDEHAVRRSEHIGHVHARVGLSPNYYIGGYAIVLEEVIRKMLDQGIHTRLNGKRLGMEVATLVKTALLDMEASLSAYFKVEEQARTDAINALGAALHKMAAGDLGVQLEGLPEAYRQIEVDFNHMRHNFNAMIQQLSDSVNNIHTGTREINSATDDLATRTERQAAALTRTLETMREVTHGVEITASNARDVEASVTGVNVQARHGGAVVENAIGAMDKIQHSSEEIAKIIDVIESIAFQTNLLALNAGVEAARAGDTGRGFAVVASEVRALAHRSSESAKDIKELIGKSSADVREGVDLVAQTGAALEQIIRQISEATSQAQQITGLANSQASSLQQISNDIAHMDVSTQQNAAMVEQANAAVRTLDAEANALSGIVGDFQLEHRSGLHPARRGQAVVVEAPRLVANSR